MQWLETDTGNCSVERALNVVGSKWTLLILRDAVNGVTRFDDFRNHVGISEPMLADRLKKLTAAGILETRPYRVEGQRTRYEYLLTDKGWDLYPVVIALKQWGDRYEADAAGTSWVVSHDCGRSVRAVVECSHDRSPVDARTVLTRSGPGARRAADDRA